MKRNKNFLWIFVVLLLPMVMAISSLGVFQQNDNIELLQVCDNCSSVNLTTIQFPNSTILEVNIIMTPVQTTYNYTFETTDLLGQYIYTTCGNPDGTFVCESVSLEVTTTGEKVSLSNSIIVIVFLLIAGGFMYLGSVFEKEKWIVKTAFHLFAITMGLLAVNSARIIVSESTDLTLMGTSGFILVIAVLLFMFLYIFIFATVNVFKQIKHRNEIKWNY